MPGDRHRRKRAGDGDDGDEGRRARDRLSGETRSASSEFRTALCCDGVGSSATNVTMCDAAYIALAEIMDATLVTADQRLTNAPGTTCTFELLQ